MPGNKHGVDKATGRVVALIVLLIIAAAALRGYLPAYHPAPRVQPGGGQAALVSVVVVLSATLTLLAIAIIARLRDPRAMAPGPGDLSGMLGNRAGRPTRRVLLIGLAVVAAWLLIAMLLSRLWLPHDVTLSAPPPDQTAPPPNGAAPAPKRHPQDNTANMLGILLAGIIPILLLTVVGSVIMSRRRWRAATSGTIADDDTEFPAHPKRSESLVRAAERGLAEMVDLSREPREAIIACYAAMERELANVPGAAPQDFDTATEVLARAVEHHAVHVDNAVQLVNLFAEARFSPHVMNEGHRESAVRALRLVLDELGSRIST
ncbi:MAG: DUF4129 domain-containing protein [Mycobacterium sp.]